MNKVRNEGTPQRNLLWSKRRLAISGVIAAVVLFLGMTPLKGISDAKALELLQATQASVQRLSGPISIAFVTMLLLVFSLYVLERRRSSLAQRPYYRPLKYITWLYTLLLGGMILLPMAINVLIDRPFLMAINGYQLTYYATIICVALLGGFLISATFSLGSAMWKFLFPRLTSSSS